ncbi:MAG: AI-2E family transporter [Steroidobacteraceae bacterium]
MPTSFYQRSFALIAIAILALLTWRILEPFFGALAWGGFLAFVLQPLQRWLARRLRGREGLAAGILVVLTPIVLLGPLSVLGVAFARQASHLVRTLQHSDFGELRARLAGVENWPVIRQAQDWFGGNMVMSIEQLRQWLIDNGQGMLKSAAAAGGNVVLGAVGTVVGFFLMLFLLFFLLRDGRQMLERLVHLVPLPGARRTELTQLIANTTRGVIYGTGLTAIVQGLLVGIGFAILSLPSPVVFGVLAAIASLLPAGGTALVWGPALVWLLAVGRYGAAVFLLAWGIAVSLSDNFLRPLLISSHAPVSTLAVFVGVVGGIAAFGPIGLIVGPVFLTLIGALLRFAEESLPRSG